MTAPTIVQRLARLAADTREHGLPEGMRDDVARRVLDLLGNSLAATGEVSASAVTAVVRGWGGPEDATAIGTGLRVPAAAAALVNGTLAHSLDFDDTHLPSVLHPSSSVVAAALAVAEATGATGPALLDAAGVGIEVAVRLGMGGYDAELGNSEFFERGQHATSICGAIGAAVAAATVGGLDADGIAHAAGIAASMGSGLIEANRTGGTVKRVHCGWAAHAGVVAADLARHGLTGPPTVIEGRFGFLHAFCGERADVDAVVDRLGEHWELPGIFFKPYPCNHFTHAGVDAALELRSRGVRPEDVTAIELGAPTAVLRTIGEPAEEKARPRSGYHAAFSGPYTVAAALTGGGGLGLFHEDFTDEAAADPDRLRLAALVRCVPDARCDEIFPHQFPAVLRVETRDGTRHEVRVDANRGGPANPLSSAEVAEKFRLNAIRLLDDGTAREVADAALDLPHAADVRTLMSGVRG
ncbi:MmgE/PrpD family protein [Blastococcus sp. BMG 814]|uniref:MmgE/PrpD family protein n=1 Tax=Blastococcus carthaginiensis TaxID=3050034 RepID=A0ABT9I7P4_9ACTN|nr:MmgE/PrpD family protein [Blastococcus carthaginiensis]MDP5181224.1 MmgE/PrpD family protein [Blastococcus carthaginiensis]